MRLPEPPTVVLKAALRARRRLLDAVDRGVPAEVALIDLSWGLQRTAVAGALVTSGLADALGERRRTPAELAAELGLDPDVTRRVLGAAEVARLLEWDGDGQARLTRTGAPLRRDHPASVASWMATQASPPVIRAYENLHVQLREGAEPSGIRRATDGSLWDYYTAHPDDGARFGEAMRELTRIDLAALAGGYPWPEEGVLCDVAGGIGTLLAAILERRPRLRGVLVDDPGVLGEAEGFLRSRGMADRIERRAGDLFGEIDASADVYVMKWILHDWSDRTCREILACVRATAPAGAKVVAIDQHLEPHRPSAVASIADVHMMAVCEGGRERNPQQVQALMRDAGWSPGGVHHVGLHMLVEGLA